MLIFYYFFQYSSSSFAKLVHPVRDFSGQISFISNVGIKYF